MIYRLVYQAGNSAEGGIDLYVPGMAEEINKQTGVKEGNLDVLTPSLEMELNSAGTLTFTVPPYHKHWGLLEVFNGEIDVYEDGDLIWFGRPLQIVRDWNNQRVITCEGALSYFNDSVQFPKTYKTSKTLLYADPEQPNKTGFLNDLLKTHNDQVSENRQIFLGNVTIPNVGVYREVDYDTTADCLQRMCLDVYGGYFMFRKEYDETNHVWVRYLDWYKEAPYGTDQKILFGLNMLDISQDLNGSDIVTVLLPSGKDDLHVSGFKVVTEEDADKYWGCTHPVKDSPFIEHAEGVKKYGRVLAQKTFDDFSDKEELFKEAAEWLGNKNTDVVTIECTSADLHYIGDPDDRPAKFIVGAKVKVISQPHGLVGNVEQDDKNIIFPMYKISTSLDSGIKKITVGTPPKKELTDILAPAGGSTRSSGGSSTGNGGSGGSGGGGSTSVPVKSVLVNGTTVVHNKVAEIVLEAGDGITLTEKEKGALEISATGVGSVVDVTLDGTSVVNEQGIAELQTPTIPVTDVTVNGSSVVNQNGVAQVPKITAIEANPSDNPSDELSIIKIDNTVYSIKGGSVEDVQINQTSIIDPNGIVELGDLSQYVVTANTSSPTLYLTSFVNKARDPRYVMESTTELHLSPTQYGAYFNLIDFFERKLEWSDCFSITPESYYESGDPNPYFKPTVGFKDGQYPLFGLRINGEMLYKYNSTFSAFPNLDFIAGNGISISAGTSNFYQDGYVRIGYNDMYNPTYTVCYNEYQPIDPISTSPRYEYSDEYIIEDSGSYLIFATNIYNDDLDIDVLGGNRTIFYDEDNYVSGTRTVVILANVANNTKVVFSAGHDQPLNKASDFMRVVIRLNNFNLTSAYMMYQHAKYTTDESIAINYASSYSVLGFEILMKSEYQTAINDMYFTYVPTGESERQNIEEYFKEKDGWNKVYWRLYYENSPSISEQKTFRWYFSHNSSLSKVDNYVSYLFAFRLPIFHEHTGYITDSELNSAVSSLQSNFQDGVDDIYDACVAKGSTPVSYSLSDVVNAVYNIPTSGILGTKSITSNGIYLASDDSLDGYSRVDVNVTASDTKALGVDSIVTSTALPIGVYNLLIKDSALNNINDLASSFSYSASKPTNIPENSGKYYFIICLWGGTGNYPQITSATNGTLTKIGSFCYSTNSRNNLYLLEKEDETLSSTLTIQSIDSLVYIPIKHKNFDNHWFSFSNDGYSSLTIPRGNSDYYILAVETIDQTAATSPNVSCVSSIIGGDIQKMGKVAYSSNNLSEMYYVRNNKISDITINFTKNSACYGYLRQNSLPMLQRYLAQPTITDTFLSTLNNASYIKDLTETYYDVTITSGSGYEGFCIKLGQLSVGSHAVVELELSIDKASSSTSYCYGICVETSSPSNVTSSTYNKITLLDLKRTIQSYEKYKFAFPIDNELEYYLYFCLGAVGSGSTSFIINSLSLYTVNWS